MSAHAWITTSAGFAFPSLVMLILGTGLRRIARRKDKAGHIERDPGAALYDKIWDGMTPWLVALGKVGLVVSACLTTGVAFRLLGE